MSVITGYEFHYWPWMSLLAMTVITGYNCHYWLMAMNIITGYDCHYWLWLSLLSMNVITGYDCHYWLWMSLLAMNVITGYECHYWLWISLLAINIITGYEYPVWPSHGSRLWILLNLVLYLSRFQNKMAKISRASHPDIEWATYLAIWNLPLEIENSFYSIFTGV